MECSKKCESCFSYIKGICSEAYDSIKECEEYNGYKNKHEEQQAMENSGYKSFEEMDDYMESGIE